jgi:hypothetical protein
VVLLFLLAILVFGFCITFIDYFRAGIWHKRNGDYVNIDGHRLMLPKDWWEYSKGQNGSHILTSVSVGLRDTSSGIRVYRVESGTEFEDDADVLKTVRQMVALARQSQSDSKAMTSASLAVIQSHSVTFYCYKEMLPNGEFRLGCMAAQFPDRLECAGPAKSEKSVEEIISTLDM